MTIWPLRVLAFRPRCLDSDYASLLNLIQTSTHYLDLIQFQDQYHSAQSDRWFDKADPNIGWNGITKATPLKQVSYVVL